ncbi:MAG: hypothetical protein ACR2JI_05625 [Mycobacterium sp.]
MTDTHAPATGPLTPMFDTGVQPTASPGTEPHAAPIFDTGPHPEPLRALGSESAAEPELEPHPSAPQAFSELGTDDTDAFLRAFAGHAVPVAVPAQPVEVPGSYQFVGRWRFALILAGVWVVSTAAGLGFYYWWYTAPNKTLPVLGILLYLGACMVAAILVSLVPDRPQVSALAMALMAAPLASTAAAAVLHGAYYFEWIARPVIG